MLGHGSTAEGSLSGETAGTSHIVSLAHKATGLRIAVTVRLDPRAENDCIVNAHCAPLVAKAHAERLALESAPDYELLVGTP